MLLLCKSFSAFYNSTGKIIKIKFLVRSTMIQRKVLLRLSDTINFDGPFHFAFFKPLDRRAKLARINFERFTPSPRSVRFVNAFIKLADTATTCLIF